ncbi:MAG TPA: PAC2 family protein [Syntrophorhabdaceae bacterium]|nr:PAC2 family protein [Syntrophorhabdaceae bacterium]
MRIGAFEVQVNLAECNEPYVIATLNPWLDVNGIGTAVLRELSKRYNGVEIARLFRPGDFYDFTRYRPTIHIDEGIQEVKIPNTVIRLVKQGAHDFLLIRMLEPHAGAEGYISSLLKVFKSLGVKKYILLGSMYDTVPHTKPLLVSGYGAGESIASEMKKAGLLPISYKGPSSIVNLVAKEAATAGIEVIVLIVSVPQYVVLDEDRIGKVRLMEVLNTLYNIPLDKEDFEKALQQRESINERLSTSAELRLLLPQLENIYDSRIKRIQSETGVPLEPEMEELLWKIAGKDVGKA